ncbi:MAG: hypothetical protein JEY97_01580 [Bacteroidales bacterium]|nr:hypothetical protein [Bacteroidales bacterium]
MKIFLNITIIFFIVNNVFGQYINRVNYFNQPNNYYELNQNDTLGLFDSLEKKLKIRLEVGAGFGLGFQNTTFSNSFIIPQFSYIVSPKLSFNGGMILGRNNFLNSSNELLNYFPEKGNFTYTCLYGEGQYWINDKLSIKGMLFRESNLQNDPKINPRAFDIENQGIMLEFQYFINENFSIEGGFGVSKGNSRYFNNGKRFSNNFMFNKNKQFGE